MNLGRYSGALAVLALIGAGWGATTLDDNAAGDITLTHRAAVSTVKPEPGFIGDGMVLVGADIKPGTYISSNPAGQPCYWARLSGLTGALDEIIANSNQPGRQIVTIPDSDVAFQSWGCTHWAPTKLAGR